MKSVKSIGLILLLLIGGGEAGRAEIPAGWSTNFPATLAAAAKAHVPAMVYFTASWCGPCKLMSRLTLTDPVIQETLSNLDYVGVDIDENPDLAAKYDVSAVPTFVMLATAENVSGRTTGFEPVGDFLGWLTNSVAGAKEAMARQEIVGQKLAAAIQLLGAADTNSLHLAAAKLFDLCDLRDDAVVQACAAQLKKIADRDPAILLDGLGDPRLATRIQVANALRARLGDTFDIDPWSGAASRQKKIAVWRETLAKFWDSSKI